jgi:two-component system, cell cycle sensor histidine kinase and response regulator CckA
MRRKRLYPKDSGARRLGSGDDATGIPEQGPADMALTSNAFNQMSEQLRQSLDSLKQSRDRYNLLYKEAPLLLHSTDQTGALVEVSEYWLKTLGYERDEVLGRKATDFYTEESRKYFQDVVLPAFFRDGVCKGIALQFVKKNGELVDVILTATGERDGAGNVVRSMAVIEDVTERKKAKEAIQESEAYQRGILESTADGILVVDTHGKTILSNQRFADLWKIPRSIIDTGDDKGMLDFVLNQLSDPDAFLAKVRMLYGTEQTDSDTLLFKDGRIFERFSAPLLRQGTLLGRVWSFRDVTERKKAETALQRSEQIYRTIITNIRDTFYRTDKNGLLVMASPSALSMFGYDTLEEIVGKMTAASFYKDLSERELLMEKMKKDGFVKDYELTLVRKDGSIIPISLSSTCYTDSNGEFAGFEGFIRDISERKQFEEERLKTQKLEAVGTLAGGIAHDFNNLLQGVFGYISLAKLTWDDKEKSRAAFEQAEKALHRSVKLTSQLLTFSKGGKPVKKPIDLLPVIENAAKFALSGSRSDYHIIADDGISQAEADDGQIGQVIQNIVLNADQSMPAGGTVELVIRNIQAPGKDLPQGMEKGNYIEIAIKDSGIGIAEEYLGRIFDPYFTMKEKGSGLGLATSYSIIKNHNGLIDVKSIVAKGTVFSIYLPAVAEEQKKEPVQPAEAVASVRAAKVLIMDDDQVILDVAGALLSKLGHEVEFAAQGKEAIDKYRTAKQSGKPFDVVILDLTIRGGMGGAETIKILREIDPAVKAVVSSGYSDDADVSTCHQIGFSAFLKKPYDADKIRNIMNEVLSS